MAALLEAILLPRSRSLAFSSLRSGSSITSRCLTKRASMKARLHLLPLYRPCTRAPFHSSTPRSILPAGPQIVDGTVNDPAPIHSPSPTHGSYHWTFERLISAGLIPLTIAPFAAGTLNPTLDALLCATIVIHSHIGFQAVIIDYIPTKRLPKVRAIFWWGLRAATVLVGVGLYEFETNDVGVTEAIKRIWVA